MAQLVTVPLGSRIERILVTRARRIAKNSERRNQTRDERAECAGELGAIIECLGEGLVEETQAA